MTRCEASSSWGGDGRPMDAIIVPGPLSGEVVAPSSKSEAHRALICAALSPGITDITCSTSSDDIEATRSCLEALGARIARTRDGFRVRPLRGSSATDNVPEATRGATLDCGESGSTMRFLLPVVAALGCEASLLGHGRLPERPLSPLYEELVSHGVTLSPQGTNPLRVGGRLEPSGFELPGNVSSQFVSGLLLAAPVLRSPIQVVVSEPVESMSYIDITASVLRQFGVDVTSSRTTASGGGSAIAYVACAPNGLSTPGSLSVGGDWSNAAFWLAAGAIGAGQIAVSGLDQASPQGDRQILAALALLGAGIRRRTTGAMATDERLRGARLDVSDCPDLVPPIAAVASVCPGATTIVGAARLRLKESDRIESVCSVINALGGSARPTADGMVIEGVSSLRGGTVDSASDHRIAMMASVMAMRCESPVKVRGAECVAKSYPAFFEDLASLGGVVREEN